MTFPCWWWFLKSLTSDQDDATHPIDPTEAFLSLILICCRWSNAVNFQLRRHCLEFCVWCILFIYGYVAFIGTSQTTKMSYFNAEDYVSNLYRTCVWLLWIQRGNWSRISMPTMIFQIVNFWSKWCCTPNWSYWGIFLHSTRGLFLSLHFISSRVTSNLVHSFQSWRWICTVLHCTSTTPIKTVDLHYIKRLRSSRPSINCRSRWWSTSDNLKLHVDQK